MTDDTYHVEVNHPDADTVSFAADEDSGTVRMYLVDMDGAVPVGELAEFSPEALDAVLEQAAGAKHDLERDGGTDGPSA